MQAFERVVLQAVHTAPPLPHADCEVPLAQVLPLQHPLLQVVGSHTQLPDDEQRCPLLHCGPLPQAHAPVAEQLSERVELQLAQDPALMPQWPCVGGS